MLESVMGRGWFFLRRYGVARTLRTLMRRYVWCCDEWVIVKSTLPGPRAEDRVGDVTFRLATPADLQNYGLIGARNVPSLRMSRRKGSELVSYVSHRRVLFWGRVVASKSFAKELDARTWTGLAR